MPGCARYSAELSWKGQLKSLVVGRHRGSWVVPRALRPNAENAFGAVLLPQRVKENNV